MAYRVVIRLGYDSDLTYTIEDVQPHSNPNVHPIVRHEPYGLLAAGSLKELRAVLRAMLKACDTKPMVWEPARLVEKKQ